MIIADNYLLPPPCRSPALKEVYSKLRSQWNGVQIYLKGGVRLISPLYVSRVPVPDAIRIAITDSGKSIKYIKDVAAPPPPAEAAAEDPPPALSPEEEVPAASFAHPM